MGWRGWGVLGGGFVYRVEQGWGLRVGVEGMGREEGEDMEASTGSLCARGYVVGSV